MVLQRAEHAAQAKMGLLAAVEAAEHDHATIDP